MAQMEEDEYGDVDYREENMKWQKSVVRERIKEDLKNDPELMDEIMSEIRKEKLEKIKRKI
jgi:hypothetical protein